MGGGGLANGAALVGGAGREGAGDFLHAGEGARGLRSEASDGCIDIQSSRLTLLAW